MMKKLAFGFLCVFLHLSNDVYAQDIDDMSRRLSMLTNGFSTINELGYSCYLALNAFGVDAIDKYDCKPFLEKIKGEYVLTLLDECNRLMKWRTVQMRNIEVNGDDIVKDDPDAARKLIILVTEIKKNCSDGEFAKYPFIHRAVEKMESLYGLN